MATSLVAGWQGPLPPVAVARELRAAGINTVPGRGAKLVVVASADGNVPAAPAAVSWIWAPARAVAAERSAAAILAGAYEVVPLDAAGAGARLAARLRELAVAQPEPGEAAAFVSRSEASRLVLAQIARAARTSMPVLITGETGTGKEVTARLLHQWSARGRGPFVAINCAAIPDELMESELFGYAKGAFSGAVARYDGHLTAAEGGTVFLDEIDDTPLPLQVKLLRVLEDRVVSRLGENESHRVDFRILAATNRDLGALIAQGRFGADLFERLAIVRIQLPPLRERPEDLPLLIPHLFERFYREEPAARARGEVRAVSAAAGKALEAYPWPGNIRELRNVIFEALVYKRAGDELLLSDLPRRIVARDDGPARGIVDRVELARRFGAGSMNLRAAVEELERGALELALERAGGNATAAGRLLGEVGRGEARDPGGTVRAMMRRLGLHHRHRR